MHIQDETPHYFLVFFSFLQITETENMMDRIVSGLSESSIKVRLSAVRYSVTHHDDIDVDTSVVANTNLLKFSLLCAKNLTDTWKQY